MYSLGISAYYHDSACALIKNGSIVAAAQEERFSRKKHDNSFPKNALLYCLTEAKITLDDLDHIVFYEKPFLKFERLLETYLAFAPRGFKSFSSSMPIWIKEKLFQKKMLLDELAALSENNINLEEKIYFSEHHLSHAASAYFPSPFEDAAILTMDGVGEWATTSVFVGEKNTLTPLKEIHFPHSLGLLYSAFTYYTGFRVNSGEYKVMGLAPYGEPKYADLIKEHLISINPDGSFRLNMHYFDFCTGLRMTNKNFNKLMGGEARKPESPLSQKEMDIAASIQLVTQEIVVKIAKNIRKETGKKNLCLAGGVALNCVANGILQREKIFDQIWIQPAAGDAGGALGAALAFWYKSIEADQSKNFNKANSEMQGAYLGPNFNKDQIKKSLKDCGAVFDMHNYDDVIDLTTSAIINGNAIGWMQGRMEFGPRALGNRSIIADPRSEDMQKQLNLKVKFRESFRPFAPSVLFEHVEDWFDIAIESPYMLLVANVNKQKCFKISDLDKNLFGIDKLNIPRSEIPAITHVDFSARVQTVHSETNELYHLLIKNFYEKTGCPVLVNTSFNVRGEPIVCSPEDAFKCFMGTNLDILVIENFVLHKTMQDKSLLQNYKDKYELD